MNLRNSLRKKDPYLYQVVMNIRTAVEPILARPVLPHFTDHSIEHSERLIEKLGDLVEGMMKSTARLLPTEVCILLASAYLHDIGMQDEQSVGADLEAQAKAEAIRDRHHERTERIILESFEQSKGATVLSPMLPPSVVNAIALVAKGHRRVDLYDKEYDDFVLGSEIVRPRLLAALLRFADELDIDDRRVYMPSLDLMNLLPASILHWYKCYYVSGVKIKDEYVVACFQFPEGQAERYKELIIPLVQPKITDTLVELQEIFRKHSVKIAVGQPQVREIPGLKSMPPEVESLAHNETTNWYDQEMSRLKKARSNIPVPALPQQVA